MASAAECEEATKTNTTVTSANCYDLHFIVLLVRAMVAYSSPPDPPCICVLGGPGYEHRIGIQLIGVGAAYTTALRNLGHTRHNYVKT